MQRADPSCAANAAEESVQYPVHPRREQQIRPSDVMIISPYKAQGSLVTTLWRKPGAAPGPRGTIVIVLLAKPSEVSEVRLIARKERLTVGLSLAVVGNMRLWP
ncbi:hypothetical protein N7449_005762 [Penicillium cf. viridicatum]|uniref:DNA2/NAM7 helicase-like C-terminal domain-containing protein n=1 Tax=Penicillium cf. viridicatum TaxID=2972119 RepID=A0A9W9SW42_9EURO|nr:hypothetical protein N7449_005762 [Penicillium cf. viridicatum]